MFRNISRRLERLEGHFLPSGDPDLIIVTWVTKDGEVVIKQIGGGSARELEDRGNKPP